MGVLGFQENINVLNVEVPVCLQTNVMGTSFQEKVVPDPLCAVYQVKLIHISLITVVSQLTSVFPVKNVNSQCSHRAEISHVGSQEHQMMMSR